MQYTNNLKNIVIIPELLSLRTNVIDFIPYFSLGAFMHETYKEKTLINLGFEVVNDIEKPKELTKKIENFYGEDQIPIVYYEKVFTKNIKFKMLIKKTNSGFDFLVNKLYAKYCPFRIDRMYPSGGHLLNAAILCLANEGYAVVHSACISKNSQGVLLAASSNTGKSLTTFSSLKKGYKILSEDMLALNEYYAFSSPLISSRSCYEQSLGKKYPKNRQFFLKEYINFVSMFTGIFSFRKVLSYEPFEDFIKSGNLIKKNGINKIIILERGGNSINKIDKKECLRKFLILNRGEFNYYSDTFLRAFSYFNSDMNIGNIIKVEERVISNLINNSDCYLFQANNPKYFVDFLDEI